MDTDEMDTRPRDSATEADDQPQLPATIRTLLERVQDRARERPLVILAAASGVGFVLGRGLPRFGALAALLGVGGLVGYALTSLRSRADGDAEPDDDAADDETADTSDDAHDIHVSSSMPDANRTGGL